MVWDGRVNSVTAAVRRGYALISGFDAQGRHRSARAASRALEMLTGVEIQVGARVGPGLVVYHGRSVVICAAAVVGRDCVIHHEVTLGFRHGLAPTVGDGVSIYPGAKIFGPVHVGDGAVIGANAVVIHDVPPGRVVVNAAAILLDDDRDPGPT